MAFLLDLLPFALRCCCCCCCCPFALLLLLMSARARASITDCGVASMFSEESCAGEQADTGSDRDQASVKQSGAWGHPPTQEQVVTKGRLLHGTAAAKAMLGARLPTYQHAHATTRIMQTCPGAPPTNAAPKSAPNRSLHMHCQGCLCSPLSLDEGKCLLHLKSCKCKLNPECVHCKHACMVGAAGRLKETSMQQT